MDKHTDLNTNIYLKLEEVLRFYKPNNRAFLFDVSVHNGVIIQVIHSSYVKGLKTLNNQFSLAIHLTFDPLSTIDIDNKKVFEGLALSKDFIREDFDEIPCYAMNIGIDTKKGAEIITTILNKVYNIVNNDNVKIEHIDQGSVN